MELQLKDTQITVKLWIKRIILLRITKTILILYLIFILFFYPSLVTQQSPIIVHADYTFNIQNDYSYPKNIDYDYGLSDNDIVLSTTAFSIGDTITITANIHNYGLCLASSGYGWSSSDGRSCWGEWDFYYPTSKTVDISFRCWDDVTVDWRVELDGAHLASPSVPGVGSDDHWKIVTIDDVYVSAGSHTIFLGTYQMDSKPDYRLDWVKIGDMTIEAETYDRTGGNDPNTDLRGFLITPMGTSMLESNNLNVQIWRGNPHSGGNLLKEGFVGDTNKVADTSHVYSGTSFSAYYIENNGIGQLICQYTVQSSIEEIYVVVDSKDVLEEIDESNNIASISVRVADISVINPMSSTSWDAGTTQSITWSSENTNDHVNIYLYKGGTLQQTIATNTNNDGTYTWTIPNTLSQSTNYQIKITDGTDNTIYDYSDGYFTINKPPATISINTPSTTTNLQTGSTYTITWSSENTNDHVNIYLYKGGTLQQTIATNTNNDGTYTWTIPNTLSQSTNYQIKITDGTDNTIFDYSDGYFAITGSTFQLDYSNSNIILLFLGALIVIFIVISIISYFVVRLKKNQKSGNDLPRNQKLIEIEKKVEEWKQEGYDIHEIEILLKD